MRRVLVTGGSGFVGRHLIARLKRDFPTLEIHNLDLRPSGLGAHEHVGPLELDESFEGVPDVDSIVHLGAVSREPGFPTARYYEVNTQGTETVARWAERAGVDRIVFFSSVSVYGPAEEPTHETSPTGPETPYGMSKLLGEQALRSWQERNSSSLTIIRPGVIFGPGDDGNFDRLARAVRQGWFAFPGRTDTRKAAIYVHDVIDLTVWLLSQDGGASDLTINAVYEKASTTSEIVQFMQQALATERTRTIVIPERLARIGVGILGVAELHKPPVERTFHQRRIDKLVASSNIHGRAIKALEFDFQHDMRSAIYDWLGCSTPR